MFGNLSEEEIKEIRTSSKSKFRDCGDLFLICVIEVIATILLLTI